VAAGVVPVLTLDEHFRSDPHLMDFVARRLYGGRVDIATRMPETESRDCVRLVRTPGERDEAGVVRAEVDGAVAELRRLLREGARSVGVVTPFRAQADALETAALAAFSADELEALDLRVGTVHAFQGNERDVVIVSLGLGAGALVGGVLVYVLDARGHEVRTGTDGRVAYVSLKF
jgi:superfamily I DNA and/or RNA helicase